MHVTINGLAVPLHVLLERCYNTTMKGSRVCLIPVCFFTPWFFSDCGIALAQFQLECLPSQRVLTVWTLLDRLRYGLFDDGLSGLTYKAVHGDVLI